MPLNLWDTSGSMVKECIVMRVLSQSHDVSRWPQMS